MLYHTFPPVYDKNSAILILGSFPSVASRAQGFYYAHPQNRFWRVLARVFECEVPINRDDKIKFLLGNHIALWDCAASCDAVNSSDASLKNISPNDVGLILSGADIKAIYTNGKTAWRIYNKLILPDTKLEAVCLPSTSPANAAVGIERLVEEWGGVRGDNIR